MTPAELAHIHALSFETPRPWDEKEFASLLKSRGVFLVKDEASFALGRVVADEAELLTLAVHPNERSVGLGRARLLDFEAQAKKLGAQKSFLEVAANNNAAIALYLSVGYLKCGQRRDYYRRLNEDAVDAVVFERELF
ncbi:GNAT family N-acetyltransferase [Pseudohalocynthiibacter aestuariivivens]|jgi:[ribosomal protein S18]-alanine N-acetyltransferase|uniref:GNAT family N-acetyltransferase n=1 Tax=Pseudohalocynthiibacter aestuariivivens TaxID=1591409 RepID=A0ABV5JBM3_9RHOB|nr:MULTISPECIES: GNAT family N-acetyltransferase [Pseudohalocynthiibacter]MBS9715933.1 GNAT family N-acetyltransferase [Pseudohalocynthiibacter aestuariivivens]MCK0102511.1 GNAT family N-acetyltransferase [Pseudohalocynthiibacter sp. F2068]